MQIESELPETFTIKATLGIFRMEQIAMSVYEGHANGFVCNITISSKKKGFHYQASLFADTDIEFETAEIQGDFHFFGDLETFITSWIDNTSSEVIEDCEKDVMYLETKYGKLAYWSYNTHLDTIPVVFVHGGPGGDSNPVKSRKWHLENPVYMFDQMGCGMSDPIKDIENFTVEEYYEEMAAFIDMIPSDKVILFGASWGSGMNLIYAGLSGFKKIAGLVLPSPFISVKKWNEDTEDNLRAMGPGYLERFNELVARNDFGPEFKKIATEFNERYLFTREINREIAVAASEEEPNEVFRVLCGPNDMVTVGKLKDFDVTQYLDDIKVPTLFMCGDSDEVTVPRIVEYCQRVKGSRLSVIPYAGHATTFEQFECCRAAIQAFFRENGF